jgi:hypothetical protein
VPTSSTSRSTAPSSSKVPTADRPTRHRPDRGISARVDRANVTQSGPHPSVQRQESTRLDPPSDGEGLPAPPIWLT